MNLKRRITIAIGVITAGLGAAFWLSPKAIATDQAPTACPSRNDRAGVLNVQQIQFRDGRCSVMVSNDASDSGAYRSYTVSSHGLFMIFNSLGEGPSSTHTGSRSYFLFPRRQLPSYEVLETGDVAVHSPSGQVLLFSSSRGGILEITGTKFSEDPAINAANAGGVELTQYDGILLDTGWQLGETAFSKSRRSSKFRDANGRECEVRNTEIFSYGSEGPRLKHSTDAELARFLSQRCPGLDASTLGPRASSDAVPQVPPIQGEPLPEPVASVVRLIEKSIYDFIMLTSSG